MGRGRRRSFIVGVLTLALVAGQFPAALARAVGSSAASRGLAATAAAQNDLTWATRANMPTSRSALAVAAAPNGTLYAIGGSGGPTAVEQYNPAANTWTARAPMPTGRSGLGLALGTNGKLYAIGGSTVGEGFNPTAKVEEYDPATNTWSAKASMPTARGFLRAVTGVNGKIYAIGGISVVGTVFSPPLATVEEYDPATDTWTTKASMPTARTSLSAAAGTDGKIYVIGGIGSGGTPLNTNEAYDPVSNTWTTRAPMPTARQNLVAVAARNGKLYTVGGYDGTGPTAIVEGYDVAANTWAPDVSMPTPRYDLGAALGPNLRLYVIGGVGGAVANEEATIAGSRPVGNVYATNQGGTVSVIEPASTTVTATIPIGSSAYGIAVNPAGTRAWVADYQGNTISVIDTTTNTVVGTVSMLGSPHGIAFSLDGTRAYAAASTTNLVWVFDATTSPPSSMATIPVGTGPTGVALRPDGKRLYVANYDFDRGTTISVIDTEPGSGTQNTVRNTITVGTGPFQIAFSPDSSRAYVVNLSTDNVSIIDTATESVVATVGVGNNPTFVSVDRAGTHAYVTNLLDNDISVIDVATNTVSATIANVSQPKGIVVVGARAYVAASAASSVSIVDRGNGAALASVAVGSQPFYVAAISKPEPPLTGTAQCSEKLLPNATVELRSGTTLVATTTSNADAFFEFPNVTPGSYSLRFIGTGGSPICGESTTFDGNTSTAGTAQQCIDLANRYWPRALALTTGQSATEMLCAAGQSAWFKVRVQPGARLVARLTGPDGGPLPANYDLMMFKDIAAQLTAAKAALGATPTNPLITPQFAGDSFGGDSFGGDSFGGDSFGGDSFGGDSFGGDSFGGDSFGGDSFGGDSFGGLSPDALASVVAHSVIGVSAHNGTSREGLWHNTWSNTGDFYVRVHGRQGAFSLDGPFVLSVQLFTGICAGIRPELGSSSLAVPSGTYGALILTDTARFPAGDVATLGGALSSLGNDIGGYVADLGTDATLALAYGQWDLNRSCPEAANVVTDGIKDFVRRFVQAHPETTQVVIAGSDAVVPYRRVPDLASIAKESQYVPPVFDSSATQASLRSGYFMTQDFYTSFHPIQRLDHELYLPDLATGRLVETAAEIANMVSAYHAVGGVVRPTTSVVTGYNFFSDEARDIAAQLGATGKAVNNVPGAANALIEADSVLNGVTTIGGLPADPGAWTAADLRAALATNPGLLSLNAHMTRPNTILAANYSPFTSSDLLALAATTPNLLRDAFVWTASCHSAFDIPDAEAIPVLTPTPEMGQVWSRLGATVVGGTGYQYGETEIIDYTERLLVDLTTELRYDTGAVPVGRALVNAKRTYAGSIADFKGIHEKAILESTLFGVPSFSVDLGAAGRLVRPGDTAPFGEADLQAVAGSTLALSQEDVAVATTLARNDVPLANTNGDGATTATYYGVTSATVTPTALPSTALASGSLQATPQQPIAPLVSVPLHVSAGQLVTGAVLLGASFADVAGITPLTAVPSDQLAAPHPPFYSETFVPQRAHRVNYLRGEHLVYTPAQYVSAIDPTTGARLQKGTARTYSSATFRLYYSSGLGQSVIVNGTSFPVALAAAPAIISTRATNDGGNVDFEVLASALPGVEVQTIFVTYTAKTSLTAGAGTWTSLELRRDPTRPSRWTGSIASPGDLRYFVQAVSGTGLVGVATNLGAYFGISTPATVATPKAATSITLTAPSATFAREPLAVSAALTSGASAVAGRKIIFGLGSERAVGFTDATGLARVTLAVSAPPGGYSLTAAFDEDDVHLGSSARSPITIAKETTSLTTPTVTPASQQYSDVVHLSTTLSDRIGRLLAERTVFFQIVSETTVVQAAAAETDYRGVAQADVAIGADVGRDAVRAVFAGTIVLPGSTSLDLSDIRYEQGLSATATLAVTPEDATVTYTGDTVRAAGSAISLAGTLQDAADGAPGDITKATGTFEITLGGTPVTSVAATIAPAGAGVASATATTTLTTTGVYTVVLRAGGDYQGESAPVFLALFDASAGFVTGGGWVAPSPTTGTIFKPTGKVSFGFNFKYQSGSTVPIGNLQLQQQNGPAFKAATADWLVINGSTAQVEGSGTLNGATGYRYRVTVVDGAPDTLGIAIWNAGTGFATPLDSLPATSLGGGSIVVHQ